VSDTLALAKQLIAEPSITPHDGECQNIISSRLQALGFQTESLNFNHVKNLWAKRGETRPMFCFAGHTDVVPPGNLTHWDSLPFEPSVRNGLLYGRGAADMKSSLAAMITACERYVKKKPEHHGSIAFVITSNEEGTDNQDGTQAVLKELHKRQEIPNWCLVGEASSEQKFADTIKVGRRGSLTAQLTIYGKQGHVAYPQKAQNPIHLAFVALNEIASLTWPAHAQAFPASSLQITQIHAGTGANNVIPGELSCIFNIRFSPDHNPQDIENQIRAILNAYSLQYEIEWNLSAKPYHCDEKSIFLQRVCGVIEQHEGFYPQCSTSGGTSDGRFFSEYPCDVIELGPLNETIHQYNECISLNELERLSFIYEQILIAMLS